MKLRESVLIIFFSLASFPTLEEKMEADQKSVYVGNVKNIGLRSDQMFYV